MILKVLTMLVVFLMLVFTISYVFENMSNTPVRLKASNLPSNNFDKIKYTDVPVFAENMRFDHNFISYFIEEDCDNVRKENTIAAFNIFSENVKIVSFYLGNENSDISVKCSDEFVDFGDNLFAAGEGGPSRIVNTSRFKIIEKGRILLYSDEECDYPVVALHELGHVFGFDHSKDPSNIMYNVSSCDQRMSKDMIDVMTKLYSIEALPDARIEKVEGFVDGKYIDFNISILNEGLKDIDSINLTVFADGVEVNSLDLGAIEIGFGRVLTVDNMRLFRNTESVRFVLDNDDLVRELDESNNVVEMSA